MMYIKRIRISNIRGFKYLDFSLDRGNGSYAGWTVVTGDNGSGKSSLLKAIALCLVGKDAARSLQPSLQGWPRTGTEVGESSISLDIERVPSDDGFGTRGASPKGSFGAKMVIRNTPREPVLETVHPSGRKENYAYPDRTIWSSEATGWFSCGYGPFRRVFGASNDAMQQMVAATTARYATMFNEAAALTEADRWIRDLNYKRLEGRISESRQLETLVSILSDDLIPSDLSVDTIDSDGLWLKDRHGTRLSWGEMSDGYRAALALLVDILRHMFTAYGSENLFEQDDSGKWIVARSGVILIDEIDSHLHPDWQKTIGFWFKRHFPRVQFIVTTHSPLVCQAADRNGLFRLPTPGSDDPPYRLSEEEYMTVISSRPDTILLTPLFGLAETRSTLAVDKRREYGQIKAKQRSGVPLSAEEKVRLGNLALFAENGEDA